MQIRLEKADGTVFGVGDAVASLSAFAARVADHGHSKYDNIKESGNGQNG